MRICRAPECNNPSIHHRTLCTKHKHRYRKNKDFDIPEKVKKCELLPVKFVKECKVHGYLKFDKVYIGYSKHKDKKYKYYLCKECISIKRKKLYSVNIDKYKKYALIMREKHYDKCIERDRKYKQEKLLSITEYNLLYEKQYGLCAICKNTEKSRSHQHRTKNIGEVKIKRLSIDHCHSSGKIRGLLCTKCNTALGSFNDSIQLLESAIEYLKYHSL